MRLGFVLADPAVIERVLAFKAEGSTNGFASMVVGTFMKRGGLAAHIETLRAAYRGGATRCTRRSRARCRTA